MSELRNIKGYQLIEKIGSGGLGEVYRAHQELVDRDVAVKIIKPALANRPNFIHRFDVEARLVARLEHPYIVPLYDYWRDPQGAYLVMRLIRQGSLRDDMNQRGAWKLDAIIKLLDQIGSALTIAHRQGIIHRDIKPENILLDDNGNAYLTDFGIAMNVQEGIRPEDADLLNYGSPTYTAPEQYRKQIVSIQADIYSMGVLFFEMVTGRIPHTGTNTREILIKHVKEGIPSIREHVSVYLPEIDSVIAKATHKDLFYRYGTIQEFLTDLQQLSGTQLMSTPVENTSNLATGVIIHTERLGETTTDTVALDTSNIAADKTGRIQHSGVRNPYKSLNPFTEADANDFFGRKAQIKALMERIEGMRTLTPRFLALVGASGSGKSSLMRAGLIPALHQERVHTNNNWYITRTQPGADPIGNLAEALNQVAIYLVDGLTESLKVDENGISKAAQKLLPSDATLYICIDQFEELFTNTVDEAVRRQYLHMLYEAANNPDVPTHIIITLRADFYDRPLSYPQFAEMLRSGTEIVLPLNAIQIAQAIEQPAKQVGLILAPNLSTRIAADFNMQDNALPLLQFMLSALFDQREDILLTNEAYDALGGISGALAQQAENLYNSLDTLQQGLVQKLFLRMVTVNQQAQATRMRASRVELLSTFEKHRADVEKILDLFATDRLLVYDRDPQTRLPTVEIAHEALLKAWRRLRGWVNEARGTLQVHQRMNSAMLEWESAHYDDSFLASGVRLIEFEALQDSPYVTLSAAEQVYLKASLDLREKELQRRRRAMWTLVSITVIAVAFALFSVLQSVRANLNAGVARARELAALAQADLLDNTQDSIRYSIESLQESQTYEGRNSLMRALQQHPNLAGYWVEGSAMRSVVVTDAAQVIVGTDDGNVQTWWPDQPDRPTQTLYMHDANVQALTITPNNEWIASADRAGQITVYDLQNDSVLQSWSAGYEIWSLAFHPDGERLISGQEDGTLTLWNIYDDEAVQSWSAHTGIIYDVAWHPDGESLVSVGEDQQANLWSLDGEPLQQINAGQNWLFTVAYSPNGRVIATSGVDGQIRFWDITDGALLYQLDSGHVDWVRDMLFDDSGQFLFTAGQDGEVRLWDTANGTLLRSPFTAHDGAVWKVAWIDGQRFVTVGNDGKAVVWDLQHPFPFILESQALGRSLFASALHPDQTHLALADDLQASLPEGYPIEIRDRHTGELLQQIAGHQGAILQMVYNADGTLLASVGLDEQVRVWDVDGTEVGNHLIRSAESLHAMVFADDDTLIFADNDAIYRWHISTNDTENIDRESTTSVYSVTLAPNGRHLGLGLRDGTVEVWDMQRGTLIDSARVHQNVVTDLRFTPNGRTLISISRDETVHLWTRATDTHQTLTDGHQDWILALMVSDDGTQFATAGQDGRVVLWYTHSGQMIGLPIVVHADWVTQLHPMDNGQFLSVGNDGTLNTWTWDVTQWQQQACALVHPTPSVCLDAMP